jgi:hypothetical protein
MIVALAGRRVDAPDAKEKRFAPENAESVKERIRDFLRAEKATPAIGADVTTASWPKLMRRAT